MLIKEPIYKSAISKKSIIDNLISDVAEQDSFGVLATSENKAFLSIVSHNIKNPFGALLGYSDLLQEDFSELCDAEKLLFVSEMKKTANYTYRYFERFFEWMYYKTGKYIVNHTAVNLRETVAKSVNQILQDTNFLGEIKFNIDANIEILADETSAVKALFYILENASTYSPKNGIIEVSASDNSDFIEIIVKDQGCGISNSKLNELFDVSVNLVPNNEGNENATGLGLILVNEIMKINKGSVRIENNCDLGTTVCIKLQKHQRIN